MVFELPGAEGGFAERARSIERHRCAHRVGRSCRPSRSFASPTGQRCDSALRIPWRRAEKGLMLHRAAAAYEPGRSDALTKLKPFLDAEATVVGYRRGKGKYAGEVGALQVETPQGRRFFIGAGLPDALRRDPRDARYQSSTIGTMS
jgi:DNA ligase-1